MLHLMVLLAAAAAPVRPELTLKQLTFADSEREISGIAWSGTDLLAVADGEEDHYIYRVKPAGSRLTLEPFVDLSKLDGYDAYLKDLAQETRAKKKDRRLDLEGVAVCGDEVYLANERVRQVIVVKGSKTIARASLALDAYGDLFAGEGNAGFEGIAADCATRTLYLAKERDPRAILVVDLKTGKLTGTHDVPPSDRAGQKVINPFNGGDGLLAIGPDFADLSFDGGYLYAIERNTFEIAKIDPKTWQVVARVSYFATEHDLYDTGEPFGVAEALALTPDEIRLGLDNNGNPPSAKTQAKHGVKDGVGAVLVFARPKGF